MSFTRSTGCATPAPAAVPAAVTEVTLRKSFDEYSDGIVAILKRRFEPRDAELATLKKAIADLKTELELKEPRAVRRSA